LLSVLESLSAPKQMPLLQPDEPGMLEYPYAGEEDDGEAVILLDEVQWYDEPSPVDDFDEEMLNGTESL
jgi:hypothetical protein